MKLTRKKGWENSKMVEEDSINDQGCWFVNWRMSSTGMRNNLRFLHLPDLTLPVQALSEIFPALLFSLFYSSWLLRFQWPVPNLLNFRVPLQSSKLLVCLCFLHLLRFLFLPASSICFFFLRYFFSPCLFLCGSEASIEQWKIKKLIKSLVCSSALFSLLALLTSAEIPIPFVPSLCRKPLEGLLLVLVNFFLLWKFFRLPLSAMAPLWFHWSFLLVIRLRELQTCWLKNSEQPLTSNLE